MQYGVELPRSIPHAYELDKRNKNTLWADALKLEINTLKQLNTFQFLPKGTKPPVGYKCIPLSGHLPSRCLEYAMSDAVEVVMLLIHPLPSHTQVLQKKILFESSVSWITGEIMWMGDVTNAFPRAKCRKQVYVIAGVEFGDLSGSVVIIKMALYSLKTSGATFHAYLANILCNLRYSGIALPLIRREQNTMSTWWSMWMISWEYPSEEPVCQAWYL